MSDTFVPFDKWGIDHFSTLAYAETKCVDFGFKVESDPRMRSNRRTYRVLSETYGPKGMEPMSPSNSTRLADSTQERGHDDWMCIQDMQATGMFKGEPEDFDLGFKIELTDLGLQVAAALRKHKADGGSFSTFHETFVQMVTKGEIHLLAISG